MKNFADKLIAACRQKNSIAVVGIDPRLEQLPPVILKNAFKSHGKTLEGAAAAFVEFGRGIIDAVAPFAVAVKPQVAFFEILGPVGMKAYADIIDYAHKANLLVIADVKRNDIGSTAEAYAKGFLGEITIDGESHTPWGADAVTVNPYLGSDGLKPFMKSASVTGGGIFVLVKTSNPSSGELQDLEADGMPVFEHVGRWVSDNGDDLLGECGYSSMGAVVGATYPAQLARLRELMPRTVFLIPGYGAQGGGAEDVRPGLNSDGLGAVVNASRSVIFAFGEEEQWTDAVAKAAEKMRDELNGVRPQ